MAGAQRARNHGRAPRVKRSLVDGLRLSHLTATRSPTARRRTDTEADGLRRAEGNAEAALHRADRARGACTLRLAGAGGAPTDGGSRRTSSGRRLTAPCSGYSPGALMRQLPSRRDYVRAHAPSGRSSPPQAWWRVRRPCPAGPSREAPAKSSQRRLRGTARGDRELAVRPHTPGKAREDHRALPLAQGRADTRTAHRPDRAEPASLASHLPQRGDIQT